METSKKTKNKTYYEGSLKYTLLYGNTSILKKNKNSTDWFKIYIIVWKPGHYTC